MREGTEGPYVGNGGSIRRGTPHEVANETSVNTAFGVERVVRYAFDLAERRRKKLTLVHKTNVLVHAGGIWKRIVDEVAAEHPDVAVDYLHVDAATIFLVTNPGRFDVIVTDNLFGDILTDLAGAVTGGIGLAASGNINPDGAFPSMFEPVHGSAPDIAGQQKADPTAAILSIALLLDHLGLRDESDAVTRAVEADIADRGTASRPRRRSATPSSPASRRNLESAPRRFEPQRTRPQESTGPQMTLIDSDPDTGLAPLEFAVTEEPRGEEPPRSATRSSSNPGFGTSFTDHMVDICWSVGGGWHRPRVQPYGPLSLDPAAAVLHYGQEIFEGIKAYRHADGSIHTFRPDQNGRRLQRSARRLALPELPVSYFIQSLRELIAVDGAWVPSRRGPEPLPAAVHVRQGGVPRRASRAEGRLLRHRLARGRVLQGRRASRSRSG